MTDDAGTTRPELFVSAWRAEERVDPARPLLIGRSPDADVVLDLDCLRFSRRCIEITAGVDGWLMHNVSRANVVPYTSGALHADLAPGTTVLLDRPDYTLYFHLGDTVQVDLRLAGLPQSDAAAETEPGAAPGADETVQYPEPSERERRVAAAILEPVLLDPTLSINCIRGFAEAGDRVGLSGKAIEHVVKDLRAVFAVYEDADEDRRGDLRAERYRLFDFLRRAGIVTAADLELLPR